MTSLPYLSQWDFSYVTGTFLVIFIVGFLWHTLYPKYNHDDYGDGENQWNVTLFSIAHFKVLLHSASKPVITGERSVIISLAIYHPSCHNKCEVLLVPNDNILFALQWQLSLLFFFLLGFPKDLFFSVQDLLHLPGSSDSFPKLSILFLCWWKIYLSTPQLTPSVSCKFQ